MALRSANLPDHLNKLFRHIHLAALYPCEYWTIENGNWKRNPHKAKTLMPLVYMLVDDLLHWQDGQYIDDPLLEEDDPRRSFLLRAILLYWVGDYPGQGEVSGFKHGTPKHGMCHWCEIVGVSDKETGSRKYARFVRWLQQGDPLRGGDTEGPPRPRTHLRACAQAKENEEWTGLVKDTPEKFTGVKWFCPLACLHLFDIIWDFMLDYMHTVKGFWEERVIAVFKGERLPAKKFKARPKTGAANFEQKTTEYKRASTAYSEMAAEHTQCTVSKAGAKTVDKRVRKLCGQPDWIKPTMVI